MVAPANAPKISAKYTSASVGEGLAPPENGAENKVR